MSSSIGAASRLGYVPGLDGLRGLAISGVLLAHGFAGTFGAAGEGVTVFFVLSGYLITTLLMEEHASCGDIALRPFYIRRAGRLWPAFALVLLATTVFDVAIGSDPVAALLIVVIAASYASNLFLGALPSHTPGNVPIIIGWTWTLSIEEQFYLAWPLVLRRLLRKRRSLATIGTITGGLAVASTGWYLALMLQGGHGMRATLGTDTRAGALLLGCALAAYLRSGRRIPRWTAWPALVVLGLVYLFPTRSWPPMTTIDVLLVPIVAAILVATTAQKGRSPLDRILEWRALTYLGGISYGVYLWNSLLHRMFYSVGLSPRGLMVLVWIPLTIGVSAACAHWVERPCRGYSRRLAERRTGPMPQRAALATAA